MRSRSLVVTVRGYTVPVLDSSGCTLRLRLRCPFALLRYAVTLRPVTHTHLLPVYCDSAVWLCAFTFNVVTYTPFNTTGLFIRGSARTRLHCRSSATPHCLHCLRLPTHTCVYRTVPLRSYRFLRVLVTYTTAPRTTFLHHTAHTAPFTTFFVTRLPGWFRTVYRCSLDFAVHRFTHYRLPRSRLFTHTLRISLPAGSCYARLFCSSFGSFGSALHILYLHWPFTWLYTGSLRLPPGFATCYTHSSRFYTPTCRARLRSRFGYCVCGYAPSGSPTFGSYA